MNDGFMDDRDLCEHDGKSALECFESYVAQIVAHWHYLISKQGEQEGERVHKLIEEYRQKFYGEPDENLRWHMYEEFRMLSW
jgi:hypothetical protein